MSRHTSALRGPLEPVAVEQAPPVPSTEIKTRTADARLTSPRALRDRLVARVRTGRLPIEGALEFAGLAALVGVAALAITQGWFGSATDSFSDWYQTNVASVVQNEVNSEVQSFSPLREGSAFYGPRLPAIGESPLPVNLDAYTPGQGAGEQPIG